MGDFFPEYYTFYYVGVTLFALAGLFLIVKFLFFSKPFKSKEPQIAFKKLNNRFEKDLRKLEKLAYEQPPLPKAALKLLRKNKKREKKAESLRKKNQASTTLQKVREQLAAQMKVSEIFKTHAAKVYVLDFVGDIMAHATDHFREEVSLLLQVASPADEVVVRLSSPGGAVAHYGLASAQLTRLKNAGMKVTICVDVIAASGGYMMAAVADKIVASPFAFIGSIGVVAGIPNFHKRCRLLSLHLREIQTHRHPVLSSHRRRQTKISGKYRRDSPRLQRTRRPQSPKSGRRGRGHRRLLVGHTSQRTRIGR